MPQSQSEGPPPKAESNPDVERGDGAGALGLLPFPGTFESSGWWLPLNIGSGPFDTSTGA